MKSQKPYRVPQTLPSQVRIDRTKMMRSSYTKSLALKSDLQNLIDEMDPNEEKRKLMEMLLQDLEDSF